MYSSPLLILLSQALKTGTTSISDTMIEKMVERSSAQIVRHFDCKNQEEHTLVLQKYPQIISTWVLYDVQYDHIQDNSCHVFEIDGDGSHILYVIDGRIEELFWFLPPTKEELPPFSYDLQNQALENVENLFNFCVHTRKSIHSEHSLQIEGFQCVPSLQNKDTITPYISSKKSSKKRSSQDMFSKSQVQIYIEPLETYFVQGHMLWR